MAKVRKNGEILLYLQSQLTNVGFQTWCQCGGMSPGVAHRQPLTEKTIMMMGPGTFTLQDWDEIIAILEKATAGTLALLGDNDYPYAVPISYVYHEGKLYFHSALAGHKVDAIRKCDKAILLCH